MKMIDIEARCLGCTLCPLSKGRQHIVFGNGPNLASVVIVGDAPGREEDQIGDPIVGLSGLILTKLLMDAGTHRFACFVTNAVMCKPPKNRDPTNAEIAACRPYLTDKIHAVNPDVVILMGEDAVRALLPKAGTLDEIRGEVFEWKGCKIVPTYHPSSTVKHPEHTALIVNDIKKALQQVR